MIHEGSSVRLHSLRNVRFNGLEALVLDQIKDKVKVEIAGTWEVIRVHRKHLTWLPTHTTSRCKLMKHRVVEMVWELPE